MRSKTSFIQFAILTAALTSTASVFGVAYANERDPSLANSLKNKNIASTTNSAASSNHGSVFHPRDERFDAYIADADEDTIATYNNDEVKSINIASASASTNGTFAGAGTTADAPAGNIQDGASKGRLSTSFAVNNASNNSSNKSEDAARKTSSSFISTHTIIRDPVEEAQDLRLKQVTDFSTALYSTMVNNPASQRYIENRQLAASSTFPLRLLRQLEKNPWRPAPFMPVPEKDLPYYYGIPPYKQPQKIDPNTTPVDISADSVTGNINSDLTYEGNVSITQADKNLKADKVTYERNTGNITATGNIIYSGPEITIISHKTIEGNLESKVANLEDVQFQLNGSLARGSADKIEIDGKANQSKVTNLKFSSCPIDNNSWFFSSDEVELAKGESFGESYGNVLYFKDVPIFYFPYINFPITNKRKSGLLYPSFALSNTNGFEYEQPIYFNLAPNYDYTFSPRYMSKRGWLLKNEFRYMPIKDTYGIIDFDYLPNDSKLRHAGFDDDDRYMLHIKQNSYFFNRDLSVLIDYQRVRSNDYNYINDIGAQGVDYTDDHLNQIFRIDYARPNYNISAEVRDYQTLLPDEYIFSPLFAMKPQIKASYTDVYGPVIFDMQGELTKFTSNGYSFDVYEATRAHFEPDITYEAFNSRGTLVRAKVHGFLTHYSQDPIEHMPNYYSEGYGFTHIDSSANRALYLLQLDAKTTLERKVFDLRHTQTLEPEIQYQYIPYRNQDGIGLYDTTDRLNDYYTNFSYRHFTGNDRIADLNELTFGLTSRFLDPHDRELMRFGISQTFSFVPTRTTLYPNDDRNMFPRSPLTVFFNANPTPEIRTQANVTYSDEFNEITSWNAMAQYRNENGFMMQVSYRFTDSGNRSISDNIIDLRQIGIVSEIPLNNKFTLTLASYRDLEQNQNIDSKVSLKYNAVCWSIAFVYENYNKTNWNDLARRNDEIYGIQFEFKGIGTVNVAGNSDKNYQDTKLLNYFDPTNLNQ